jgi:transposase
VSELLARLHGAAAGLAAEHTSDAKAEAVRALVAVLEPLVAQIARLTSAVEHAIAQLPTGRVLMSFSRAGKVCAAQITAELGDDPGRFVSEDHLAAEAGIAPVTKASGKQRAVVFRWACNRRLRSALTCFADNSRHESPWAAAVYPRARARGCDHPHAIRILARAWIRVLYRCWTEGRPYDPALHRAAKEPKIAV